MTKTNKTAKTRFNLTDHQDDFATVAVAEKQRATNVESQRAGNEKLADKSITAYAHLVVMTLNVKDALTAKGNLTAAYRKELLDGLVVYAKVKGETRLNRYTKNTANLVRCRENIGVNDNGDPVSIPTQATPEQAKACLIAAGLTSENAIQKAFEGDNSMTGNPDFDVVVRKFVGSPTYAKNGATKKPNGFRIAKQRADNPEILRELIEALESWERVAVAAESAATDETKKEAAVAAIMEVTA